LPWETFLDYWKSEEVDLLEKSMHRPMALARYFIEIMGSTGHLGELVK
jgi:hypothetical protein